MVFFSEVFDAMFRLCADSETNVQNAVQFLDNLVKVCGHGYADQSVWTGCFRMEEAGGDKGSQCHLGPWTHAAGWLRGCHPGVTCISAAGFVQASLAAHVS